MESAVKIFSTISGWKDSDEQIYVCRKRIEEIKEEQERQRLERERKAEEACIAKEKSKKKAKRIAAIVISAIAVCVAFVIVLITVIIPTSNYNKAISLLNDGKIIDAYESLIALNGYKDSTTKASEIFGQYKKEKMENAEVGKTVFFGAYEQDNNTSNGKEDVEWIVLAKENNKALVISKYALDCQQYYTSGTNVTWEECSLRTWLNGEFINNAFSFEEQALIIDTYVSADENPYYNTKSGNSTNDKVFLLSITEAEGYFTTDESRKCASTAYAKARGVYTDDEYNKTASGEATSCWCLRSPGIESDHAARVILDGSVDYFGNSVIYSNNSVRPAMWINLE